MFIIREMMQDDVDEVCKLEKEAFSMPWHKQSFIEMTQNKDALYLVAVNTDTNQVVGCCGLRNIAQEGDISNVVVEKDFRKQGIASNLLKNIIELGQERFHIKEFTLEVRVSNNLAIQLYQKHGFKSEGIRKKFYEKPIEDAMIMWKR